MSAKHLWSSIHSRKATVTRIRFLPVIVLFCGLAGCSEPGPVDCSSLSLEPLAQSLGDALGKPAPESWIALWATGEDEAAYDRYEQSRRGKPYARPSSRSTAPIKHDPRQLHAWYREAILSKINVRETANVDVRLERAVVVKRVAFDGTCFVLGYADYVCRGLDLQARFIAVGREQPLRICGSPLVTSRR